jgi:hypothetical protein
MYIKKRIKRNMNKEEDIEELYDELLKKYEASRNPTAVNKTRENFAMDVHEKMKQERIKKIMNELGDAVTKITSSSGDKTKLYEKFNNLLKDFKEENEYEYSYGGKKNGKKRIVKSERNSKKSNKKKKRVAHKKNKRTMRKMN